MAAKWANDSVMDAALNQVATSDKMTACAGTPTTYYEAVDPPVWAASTAYALGDVVRPTTRNSFAYECTTAGTSGATEPTWPTTAGTTVTDGTVVWTARTNRALTENAAMVGSDFTISNGVTSGRRVTIAQKTSINVHTSGTADHVALVDDGTRSLIYVTTATAQALTAGNTVTFPAWDVEIADPT